MVDEIPSLQHGEAQVLDLDLTSPAETQQLGAELAGWLEPGDLLALVGNLGSGKTTFVQGLARGLGVRESVHSPTFILANEYRSGRLPLFHVDAYRVSSAGEAIGFGLDDYLNDAGVTVIEWAERVGSAIPREHLMLEFRYVGQSERSVRLTAFGERYRALFRKFASAPILRERNGAA